MAVKQRMTAEELWEMPEVPGKRFELVRGKLREMPGAGVLHAEIVTILLFLLRPFVAERGLGRVYGDGLAYVIRRDPDTVRVPDVSFVSQARLPEGGVPEGFMPLSPDLAVEIVSPADTANEVHEKVRSYLESGVRLVWVLWPRHRAVSVYSEGDGYRELGSEDELEGGEVLPGFRVKVSQLFEVGR